jgi:hypothetical protein
MSLRQKVLSLRVAGIIASATVQYARLSYILVNRPPAQTLAHQREKKN